MKKFDLKIIALLSAMMLIFTACENDSGNDGDSIPSDSEAGDPPVITDGNVSKNIPNPLFGVSDDDPSIITMQMTGIKKSNSDDFIVMNGTGTDNQTCWLQVDGENKGILVNDISSVQSKSAAVELLADVVFVVDNSGSMGQEADTIASHISNWAQYLKEEGLNIRTGIVGYDGDITGALNLCETEDLTNYLLNRKTYWGYLVTDLERTQGFAGDDSLALLNNADSFNEEYGSYGENGILAIRFADEYFDWRSNANRVYVNFTDEPNQPSGDSAISVYYIAEKWLVNQGTIHTVYSEDTTRYWSDLYDERPWLASEYTGGSILFINDKATDLDLTSMPVTGALAESFMIQFRNTSTQDSHDVIIYISDEESGSNGKRIFEGVSFDN